MPQSKLVRLIGQIFQSPTHKRDDLVSPRLRADELRIFFVQLQQLALEGGELEEVVFFAHRFRDAPAIRAGRARRRIDIQLVRDAILAGVAALVDEAALLQYPEELLHALAVALFRGPYVVVVTQPHAIPQGAELAGDGGSKLLGRLSCLPGRTFDLLPMLVCPGEKPCVKAQGSLAPGDGVGHYRGVCVADVGPGIHVIDRGGDVKAWEYRTWARR